jgi:hypothetical protein
LSFTKKNGILSGVPLENGTARFVIRAKDNAGGLEEQAYELLIHSEQQSSKSVERWLAGILLLLLLFVWLMTFPQLKRTQRIINNMEQSYHDGNTQYAMETGHGITEYVDLPSGIYTYHGNLRGFKKFVKVLGWSIFIVAIWFAWRLWSN